MTAQVLRLLDSARRALAKKELFAVKGPERRQPLPRTMRSPPRIALKWYRRAPGGTQNAYSPRNIHSVAGRLNILFASLRI